MIDAFGRSTLVGLLGLALAGPSVASAASKAASDKVAKKPAPLIFTTTAKDSHAIELNDWAARNHLHDANSPEGQVRLRLLVVGCNAPGAECVFVHEGDKRVSIFEPRLRNDWAESLRQELPPQKIREMVCLSAAKNAGGMAAEGPTGKCRVTLADRTREELRRSSPAVARVIAGERSPSAAINLVPKRKR